VALITEHLLPALVVFRSEPASKIAALRQITEHLTQAGAVTDAEACLTAIQDRERLMTTGIGKGVALPHAFTPAAPATVIGYLRVDEGVDYDAVDEKLVRHLFCILGPPAAQGRHLKILARLARLLNSQACIQALAAAPTPEAVVEAIRSQEEALQPNG
jgi:mannitol/fructose-specific phosphotransferase system IIA component (Ntr-type)